MIKSLTTTLAIFATTLSVADARPRHARVSHAIENIDLSARRSSCDGFHRCRCGTTAARHFGLSYSHNGMNLKMARAWYGFPRTAFHIGAAGVMPHHVLAVVGGSSCSSAIVHDDAGTRQRNVCHMTFVQPGGLRGQHADYVEALPQKDTSP